MAAAVAKGTVLRVEKTSIHDGAGLRTVVFLKGCPLKCKWCSTPESQSMCIEYGYGKIMTAKEVIREVCKDEIFYFHSGGGVTLSGGEVLLQADFAREIVKGCREEGVETAIETSLYADYKNIEKLLPYLNDVYVDFKIDDEERHVFYTGVSNRKIKENILRLAREFKGGIHIRIPVIPTVNLSEKNMRQSAMFFEGLQKITDIELLPYHRLGNETYRKLGWIYELKDIETPNMTIMREMAEVIRAQFPTCLVKIKGSP